MKVDDVVALCDLKQAAGPTGLRKGRSRRLRPWPMNLILVRSMKSCPPKSLMVPLNESCSSTSSAGVDDGQLGMWLKDGAGVQYQLLRHRSWSAPSTVPPDSTLAAAVTLGSFGSLIVSALTTPPAETLSVPPLPTDTPLAVPPEDTFIVPPLLTEAVSAVPPEETFNVPPVTDVPLSVPPEDTFDACRREPARSAADIVRAAATNAP